MTVFDRIRPADASDARHRCSHLPPFAAVAQWANISATHGKHSADRLLTICSKQVYAYRPRCRCWPSPSRPRTQR